MIKLNLTLALLALLAAGSAAGVCGQIPAGIPEPARAGNRPLRPAEDQPVELITQITQEDMSILLADAPPEELQKFAINRKSRQDVLRNLGTLIAEAVEAKNIGMADSAEVKDQLAFMRSLAIAQGYDAGQRKGETAPPFGFIPQSDVDAFLSQPGMDAKFDHFVKVAQAGKILPEGVIPDDQKVHLKQDWAKILLTEAKAVAGGFDRQRKTQLQISLQQATLLSQEYITQKLTPLVIASGQEIANYVAQHPEYDIASKRAKAEGLLRRARAGENFAKLALEYSDDPGSKASGGFYDWFSRGHMVKEFEDAAFGMRIGQISGLVETQYGFHIIKLIGRRSIKNPETGKFKAQVRVRHILVSTMAPPDPENPMAPQVSLADKAKDAIEKGKRDRLIDELLVRTKVVVPDDFTVVAPAKLAAPATPRVVNP